MTVAAIGALLSIRGHQARILQTLTAFFGTSTLLYFVVLPPVLTLRQFDDNTLPAILANATVLVTWFWQWLIQGHILHRSMNIDRTFGILLAIVLWVIADEVIRYMYQSLSGGVQ